MYIYDSVLTLDAQEMQITRDYPKEVIILGEDSMTGMLIPLFVRVTKFVPVPNKKVTIDTAENGYVVFHNGKTKIVKNNDSGWEDELRLTIDSFFNKEVETERDLKEDELTNDDFLEQLAKMNVEYQELKDAQE